MSKIIRPIEFDRKTIRMVGKTTQDQPAEIIIFPGNKDNANNLPQVKEL